MVDGGVQGGHVLQDGQDVPAGLHHPAEVQRLQARRAQASQPLHTAGKHPWALWVPFGDPPAQPSPAGKGSAPTLPSGADEAILRRRSCSPASVAYCASSYRTLVRGGLVMSR